MKRVWLAGGVIFTLLVTGCNDETTLTPGDPADPSFQSFQEDFGSVDEATGSMTQAAFDVIGEVFGQQSATAPPTFQGVTTSLEYNEAVQFWVGHLVLDNEDGGVATFSDSIQFVENGHPVQYPVLETLDLVRSFLTADLSGPQGSASGFQNLTFVPNLQDSTVLVTVNGTGGLEGTFTRSNTDSSGTTDCSIEAAFATTVSQVVLNATNGPNLCPLSGTVTHHGDLHVVCTGAQARDHDGHWTVSATFENGVANISCVSGDNVWHYTRACEQ